MDNISLQSLSDKTTSVLEHFLRYKSTPEGLVLPLLMICDMTGDKAKGNLPFSAASSASFSIASLLLLPTSLNTVN